MLYLTLREGLFEGGKERESEEDLTRVLDCPLYEV